MNMLDYPKVIIISSVIGIVLSYFIYGRWIPKIAKKLVELF